MTASKDDELTDQCAGDTSTPAREETGSDSADQSGEEMTSEPPTGRRPRAVLDAAPLRLGFVVGTALVLALAALCGWLGYQANQARQESHVRALLVQVAKQAAVNLTTIDYRHAETDVQRIVDSATGSFREDFQNRSAPFIDVVKQAKSKSEGTVTEAGLEALTGQQGQVLVSVTVTSTTNGEPEGQPRYWRMRITVTQQDGGAKVSSVDFVP